jgi:fermentation-respiration switch protein FrsA (DUF1100 family)
LRHAAADRRRPGTRPTPARSPRTNARTGDEYAAAATSFEARLPGVVYVDTTGAGRLARTRITLYARTSNGTIWQLRAARGAPHLSRAE